MLFRSEGRGEGAFGNSVRALFLSVALRLPIIVSRARSPTLQVHRRHMASGARPERACGRSAASSPYRASRHSTEASPYPSSCAPKARLEVIRRSGRRGHVPANQNDFAVGVNFHPRHGKPSLHCTSSCARDLRLSEGRTAAGHGVAPPDPFSPRRSWTIVALVAGAASLREEKAATAQRRRVLLRCFVRAIANHFNKLTRCALRYLLRAIGVASPLFLLRRFLNDFNGALRSFFDRLEGFFALRRDGP